MADSTVVALKNLQPTVWLNTGLRPAGEVLRRLFLTRTDVEQASGRLERFAPVLSRLFPDTRGGIVESRLVHARHYAPGGQVLLKCDNDLPVAGSVKARGGVYEVLCRAEELAAAVGLDDYLGDAARQLFAEHTVVVASTGNLGLSVGITGRAFGFKVLVHMSRDAKAWKKALLRERGAQVVEHDGDYGTAVSHARDAAGRDPRAYFVDDETSTRLFLGYSVAALRLTGQLEAAGIHPTVQHPLMVYLPCGVGGGPGGITFGLKHAMGDAVRCYFVEPTHAPCCTLGFATGRGSDVSIADYGIDGRTEADGLAVGAPSPLVMPLMAELLDGAITVDDNELFVAMARLWHTEGVKAEPSACAALVAVDRMAEHLASRSNSAGGARSGTEGKPCGHIAWLTGGSMLPEAEFTAMLARGKRCS